MALAKFDKNKLKTQLPAKKEVVKQEPEAEVTAEDTVYKIHPKVREATIRTTVDFPDSIHRALKLKCIDTGETLREYLMRLVKQDTGIR